MLKLKHRGSPCHVRVPLLYLHIINFVAVSSVVGQAQLLWKQLLQILADCSVQTAEDCSVLLKKTLPQNPE